MDRETVSFLNITATTPAFALNLGGKYSVSVMATFPGFVSLQKLGPDGTTFIDLIETFGVSPGGSLDLKIAQFLSNGNKVFDLAPGQYRFVVEIATAVSIIIDSIPNGH